MTPEQMQQQQQMMQQQMQMQMQMQQQQQQQMQQGQPGQPQPAGRVPGAIAAQSAMMGPKEEPVRMIVNRRRNSILVQAPPDKMAIIADAVKLLDVQERGRPFAAGLSGPHAGVSAGAVGSAEAGRPPCRSWADSTPPRAWKWTQPTGPSSPTRRRRTISRFARRSRNSTAVPGTWK